MNMCLIQDVVFDDEATRLMGIAFDRACTSLPQYSGHFAVREIIAKRIVAAAKNGERSPIRLLRSTLKPFHIEPSIPMPRPGVGRGARIPPMLDHVLS